MAGLDRRQGHAAVGARRQGIVLPGRQQTDGGAGKRRAGPPFESGTPIPLFDIRPGVSLRNHFTIRPEPTIQVFPDLAAMLKKR